MLRALANRGELHFIIGFSPQWELGILHFTGVLLFLAEIRGFICGQKCSHTDLT